MPRCSDGYVYGGGDDVDYSRGGGHCNSSSVSRGIFSAGSAEAKAAGAEKAAAAYTISSYFEQ